MAFNMEADYPRVADRWYPLIFKGALSYAIPGKIEPEDLAQEGLILLLETIKQTVTIENGWDVDGFDFQKYFKSALYHRYVDRQRTFQSKKRNHKSEVHATDDYDPLETLSSLQASPEDQLIADDTLNRLRERLSTQDQQVLDAWLNPSQEILDKIRSVKVRCLNRGVVECGITYETSGSVTSSCANCGGPTSVSRCSNPSRILQSDIQNILGITRSSLAGSQYNIRMAMKTLDHPDPRKADITNLLGSLGYDTVPQVASCRLEEGRPSFTPLTYSTLCLVISANEKKFVDFMILHTSEYYQSLKFSQIAVKLGISVHDCRRLVDSLRIKIELIDSGVPIKDVPKDI